ncbi:hypothetical protein K469DRAFT_789378 [Zopfia rhizophila CBS 207.26]|uniref:DUF4470 domain-containing protein n=1 Tax=Zopfia rhizophila CBS 207.26 TaxID=1314779 RepID=A0A6A6ES58_9PEZI|nr:hypothetical protein K469DRAFT_789378 [Zopfia rhizophila CBS 207.26]
MDNRMVTTLAHKPPKANEIFKLDHLLPRPPTTFHHRPHNMSLKPSHLQQNPWFYPVGNTPAVCLTQSLPPDQNASILLLGCGDIRNILFTTYAGIRLGDRKLNFTCCDLKAKIITHNVIIFTLILDDDAGVHVQRL